MNGNIETRTGTELAAGTNYAAAGIVLDGDSPALGDALGAFNQWWIVLGYEFGRQSSNNDRESLKHEEK